MQTSDYRLAPALGARFLGALLVLLALVLAVLTLLVVVLDWPVGVLVGAAAAGVLGVAVAGWLVLRALPVVRFSAEGYRVRMIRAAGTNAAAWREVTEAVTASVRSTPVVVIKLRDGRTTTIPVQALAADREEFVRELQRYLQGGSGLRPLGSDGP
ncbi:hypothetical protein [Nocardioides pyridinolyticus]